MKFFLAIFLASIFLAAVLLEQAGRALPIRELRRRARSGKDAEAAAIYKMAAYEGSLEVLLWFVGSIAVAALFLMTVAISSWLAVALVLVASWLVVVSHPLQNLEGWLWRLSAKLSPSVSFLLLRLQPVLGRVSLRTRSKSHHSKLYEKEDILELLEKQPRQKDNRLREDELKLAVGALTFAHQKVENVMTPAKDVKMVSLSDTIGPVLMDELHASGNKYFPVVKDLKAAKPEIVGTLYSKDLLKQADGGAVRDVMKNDVQYINEEQDLYQALEAFIQAQTHMFIVTNKFEEIVGILSLEEVIEQLLGRKVDGGFDKHEDLLAVAGGEAEPEEIVATENSQE